MIADATLGWTAIDVVLDPIPGKDGHTAVVAAHRYGDGQFPFGVAQDLVDTWFQPQALGHGVKLRQSSLPEIDGGRLTRGCARCRGGGRVAGGSGSVRRWGR